METTISQKVNQHQMPKIRLNHEEMLSELTQHLSRMNDKSLAKLAEQFFGGKFQTQHSASGSYFFSKETSVRLNKYLIESINFEILEIATRTFNQLVANNGNGLPALKTKVRIALMSNATPFTERQLIRVVDQLLKGV